ncbi:hypothetical protein N3K66_007196 [Trichothecium roseum]|uniref:Uncharacterized protein n=1 Tax=Trichothecium roseum TaxID=47278 RepID=A0ACC0UTD1_9HYPO|nr:hypothetical protein N3K66_007196 [Trichothecium roseum]
MAAIDQMPAHVYHVELQGMPHEVHIRHIGEDWAGITNQAERKKLQNRLNKRISRQRKRQNMVAVGIYKSRPSSAESPGSNSTTTTTSGGSSPAASAASSAASEGYGTPASMTVCPVEQMDVSFGHCTAETIAEKRAILNRFAEQALRSYSTADPCADHRLHLIQLNIINGLTRNAAALGFNFDWLICEVVSPFGSQGRPCSSLLSSTPTAALTLQRQQHQQHQQLSAVNLRPALVVPFPETLTPTKLQLSMRHHPWVDLFLLPTLRDNLLAAAQVLTPEDEQELYNDVLEAGGGRREWAGLVVWGEPSDPGSWEISAPFFRKWGWILKGCDEILEATNRWRRQRGELPITAGVPV